VKPAVHSFFALHDLNELTVLSKWISANKLTFLYILSVLSSNPNISTAFYVAGFRPTVHVSGMKNAGSGFILWTQAFAGLAAYVVKLALAWGLASGLNPKSRPAWAWAFGSCSKSPIPQVGPGPDPALFSTPPNRRANSKCPHWRRLYLNCLDCVKCYRHWPPIVILVDKKKV
jgi:hypothetical protein